MKTKKVSIPPERYAERRRALARRVGEPILLVGHEPQPRNYLANTQPFRQDSTLLYFTGLTQPAAGAFIEPDGTTTLILPAQDEGDRLWHGDLPGWAEAAAASGAQGATSWDNFAPRACQCLVVAEPQGLNRARQWSGLDLDPRRPTHGVSQALLDAVIDLRLRRDTDELAVMRETMEITREAHLRAMGECRAGVRETAIEAGIRHTFGCNGCVEAYPSIVTARGEVLHGHASDRPLRSGELLLVDAGAEGRTGYATDVTRTWPVNGRFTARQRDVYEAVLAANERGIAAVRPGRRYRDIHLESAAVLCRALVDWKLLRGDVDGLVECGAHAVFFPHGLGHLLGLDVHDLELFGDRAGYAPGRVRSTQFGLCWLRLDRDLEPGMVVTIEPGLYFSPAILGERGLRERLGDAVDWDRAERWLPFGGVRIEDDVLCTDGAPDVLSSRIPKAVKAVEQRVGALA